MENKRELKAVMAMNNLGFIGLNGGLPWGTQAKADFRHFKELTMGGTLLVGYNTYQTLPPLKGRTIILDSRTLRIWYKELSVDWCIGGKKTYEKYMSDFTELHISHINDNSIGDTLIPDFRGLNPECKIYNYFFELG